MRAVVESEGDRLGREIVAERLVAFGLAAAHAAGRLFGQDVAELRQDLLAAELRTEGSHVRLPLFPRAGGPAGRELREDLGDLFAVGKLDGLQIVAQRRGVERLRQVEK